MSEIMTILISFHQNQYRNFKYFYQNHVCKYWRKEFPKLPSYNRFVKYMGAARINQYKVFEGIAARGKISVDWFFGFQLHLLVNDCGELLNIQITLGNVDDRKPSPDLLKSMFGKVFTDRGYVSQALASQLFQDFGFEFFAKPKRNMKNCLMRLNDKLLARKRSIIETSIDQLNNISQIEHSRHRSPINAMINVICGLIAY